MKVGVTRMRTQVGIVGAGPAGLFLGHLLHLEGIESVIIENRSRQHVIERVRAGVLEQGTVDLHDRKPAWASDCGAKACGTAASSLASTAGRHRIDFEELTGGRAITVYGQNEVVKDLMRRAPRDRRR